MKYDKIHRCVYCLNICIF